MDNLGKQTAHAAKWSVLGQIASKLITPITTMMLARILTPEAFGIVASATMVTSLADIFSDAGFQRYLIQHRFEDVKALSLHASVAFWTNLFISGILVSSTLLFADYLAVAVGNPGKGNVLRLASSSILLTTIVSVQTALFQKEFDFKTLFTSRVGSSLVSLIVSITCAILGADYWSLVIGTISSNAFLAIWLTLKSWWRPRFEYSARALKDMLIFGIWILLEAAATWVNQWASTFVIGVMLDARTIGLYKTPISMANSIMTLFTASILPVAFSALSAVQNDNVAFERVFFKMQKFLGMCLIPIAFGAFVYRHAFTYLLLGSQWVEAELLFGLWMLTSCIVIAIGYICSEAYRAKGHPEYGVAVQILYLIPYLPALIFSAKKGYDFLSLSMPIVRLLLTVINLIIMKLTIGFSPKRMLVMLKWTYAQSLLAMIPGIVVTWLSDSILAALIGAFFSVVLYCLLVYLNRDTRQLVYELVNNVGLSSTFNRLRLGGK